MHNIILQIIFKNSFKAFSKESVDAVDNQKIILQDIIRQGSKTEFGLKHHFSSIKNVDDFKKNVEIQTYESLEEDILLMVEGKKNILWPGEIKMFAKSSGTSNAKSKFIPLTNTSLQENHFKGGKDILSIYSHEFPHKNIFEGRNLSVAGSFDSHKYKIGDLSALLLANLPPWVQLKRLPSKKLALLKNWEEKIDLISSEIVNEDISSLSGVPSWNLILLQKSLQKSGKTSLSEMWPNFKLFMHGGVNFDPYKKSFEDLIGHNDFTFLETYNASEGFFAIQDKFNEEENGMLLLCNHAVFYEFLPLKDIGNPNAKTLQLDEVELHEQYALIITTKSGLWRYQIGDTIQFTTLYPFRVRITGRIKYFINVFGEELIEDNANKALKITCNKLSCEVAEYTIGPVFPDAQGKGGHEWLIEFLKAPESLVEFTRILDEEIKKVNSDYEAKRTGGLALQLPKIKILPQGTFYSWLKIKNKLGAQNKVPRLQNNRRVVDEVLAILDK